MPLTAATDLVEPLLRLDLDAARVLAGRTARARGAAVMAAHDELRRRWDRESLDGAVLASAASICLRLLAEIPSPPPDPSRLPAVVVSPLGDLVNGEAVAACIRDDGWPVDVLYGSLIPDELARHLKSRRAVALVIAAGNASSLPSLVGAIAAGHSVGVPSVATGPAFGPDDLRALRMGADAWVREPPGVSEILSRWSDQHPHVLNATSSSPDLSALEAARLPLLASVAAWSHPWASGNPESDAWEERLLVDLVDYLEAAVLVDDSRLLLEFLTPDRAATALHLLDTLASALPREQARARAFVDDARRHARLVNGRSPQSSVGPIPPHAGVEARADRGQVFNDLLLLGSAAAQAPMALVSVRRGPGRWSTLTYGAERSDALSDPVLLDFVADRDQVVEVPDLRNHELLATSPVARPPVAARWLYGTGLVGRGGSLLGVFCLLDRQRRQVSRREQRAVAAVARQLADQLEQWRRPPASAAGRPTPLAARRSQSPEGQHLLRSQEVAALFDVTERTVINWAAGGKLPALRTIGGHLRFRHDDVMALLAGRRRGAAG